MIIDFSLFQSYNFSFQRMYIIINYLKLVTNECDYDTENSKTNDGIWNKSLISILQPRMPLWKSQFRYTQILVSKAKCQDRDSN